jgi:hypothetical protein
MNRTVASRSHSLGKEMSCLTLFPDKVLVGTYYALASTVIDCAGCIESIS